MIKLIKQVSCIFLLLLIASPCLAYYNPGKPAGFVNDFANVLTNEQKQNLENKLSEFTKISSNEISVVIIKSLKDDTVENFAVQLFKDWGIGKKGKDNGVLILVAIDDRKMRIEVGYGLEGALTDAQSSWIGNQIIKPAFKSGDYYQGFNGAVDKIILATKGEYIPEDKGNETKQSGVNLDVIFYIAIFGFMWLSSILGRSKSWWLGGAIGGVVGIIIGLFKGFLFFGLISIAVLAPLGLLFDFFVSKSYQKSKASGIFPWWIGGGRGGGFGGFGGGSSGGGGFSGDW
ncbi:TPM domain-containing protein [Patescibacteria group bacterium]|nr:TPM domain-containing protein [Patescibacteria group bacterium]MBU0879681.1 TPM domain-containing protein [Patescibacteria group bacterium]MBU0880553.1 TPM domain-containing protein [Patescibacteria group bacterium]MBU0897722.1 TPM domain-containing protein [Patescibacteria group bacterium]MBU1062797.1 TPM domain-containing protein [Patescibacteria group bacterium]